MENNMKEMNTEEMEKVSGGEMRSVNPLEPSAENMIDFEKMQRIIEEKTRTTD